MAIIVNLDVMMAKRKMSATELSKKLGITMANLSILKNNKAKAVRFTTLNEICKALDCQPVHYICKNISLQKCQLFRQKEQRPHISHMTNDWKARLGMVYSCLLYTSRCV